MKLSRDKIESALLEENKYTYAIFADWKVEYITDFITAERTGTSTDNFIAWVNECLNN
ncbi:hypothetical protein NST74_15425 [Paenibacillus sp. FSL F4-0125]|uniref:hypothetical protein n=1 Tax=Paenibacillus sp. FSL F4-0125 TaxID=2954730 RepID=UPI0030FB4877